MAGEILNTSIQHDYVVLARKYRSRTFAELIGQDALVRTLTNAIAMNKIHHAYVLTGIRGTGKTSTARLLAMALNCENGPSVTWDVNDPQVEAIRTGRHVDVFEYDAASNRTVEDVQRLFEGVNYAPVAGRFKVYIIDEVHMLSNTAFNALLKTLEEPPPQVKFIFATTDVQKIPLTVLSRCQRFDLKRIPSEVLAPYFETILAKENVGFESAAVQLIARAADGSARDGLSLLDQAIALSVSEGDGQAKVLLSTVEAMLGVADRARVYDLLDTLVAGKVPEALAIVDDLYAGGSDPIGVMQGLMELVHLATRIKLVASLKEGTSLTEIERKRAVPLADRVPMPNLGRIYQLLMQGVQEVKQAERPYEALAMACVRMAYLTPLPSMDKLLGQAQGVVEEDLRAQDTGHRIAPAAQVSLEAMGVPSQEDGGRDLPIVDAGLMVAEKEIQAASVGAEVHDWAGVVKLVRGAKSGFAATLEQQVRCISFAETKLELAIDRGLMTAPDLLRDLRAILREVTGVVWDIREVAGAGGEGVNLAKVAAEADAVRKTEAATEPLIADVLGMFPGAELESVEHADNY